MNHVDPSKHAGQRVKLGKLINPSERDGLIEGAEIRIEDWWDRVAGQSWTTAQGNPAAMKYAVRTGLGGGPVDDEVLYGHIDGLGHLVHVSELA